VAPASNVNISAVYAGVTKTAALSVTPPTLSALTLTSAIVCGCKNGTGKVTLTGAAPAGGVTIQLTEAHTNATVPGTVLVAAGATTATFTILPTPLSATTGG